MKSAIKNAFYISMGVLLILSLLQPFDIDKIGAHRIWFLLGDSLLTFLACLLSSLLLQLIPAYRRFQPTSLWQAFGLIVIDSLVFTPILSAGLISFNVWFTTGHVEYAWINEAGNLTLVPFGTMCMWVALVGVIIMIWSLYRFQNSSLEQELQEVRAINALLEQHQAEAEQEPEKEMCVIQGTGQNDRMELDPHDILYIESMANYAEIVYLASGEQKRKTMRITLKQLREQLGEDLLVQCHRAFLVNLNFVQNMSVRSAGTYEIELFGTDKRIPVSRANVGQIRERLTTR